MTAVAADIYKKVFQYISCCSLSVHRQFLLYLLLGFQYISCCSLSNYLPYNPDDNYHFNTSHVVVYRRRGTHANAFKTNFNTSHVVVYQGKEKTDRRYSVDFNTSHVVVYHLVSRGLRRKNLHFNTSHVVVYLIYSVNCFLSLRISIHLML